MFKIIILIISLFTIVILLNFLIFKYIKYKAVKRYIQPQLERAGLTFKSYNWLGFFNRGDFKNDKFILLPTLAGGYPVIATYIDVFYIGESVPKKVTVRIDAFFIIIIRVIYSSEF